MYEKKNENMYYMKHKPITRLCDTINNIDNNSNKKKLRNIQPYSLTISSIN